MDRPILFSATMIQSILAGRKTQTRRLVRAPLTHNADEISGATANGDAWDFWCIPNPGFGAVCPYGGADDSLWVRETWRPHMYSHATEIEYAAGGPSRNMAGEDFKRVEAWIQRSGGFLDFYGAKKDLHTEKWFPSIHMPRWASRLTLAVTDVRVERLQAISEADARAEGVPLNSVHEEVDPTQGWLTPEGYANWQAGHDCDDAGLVGGKPAFVFSAREAYALWWDHINGKRATWESNPWVWVVAFQGPPKPEPAGLAF